MLSLGEFVFELSSLPYQGLNRSREFRFEEVERFNARPAVQFVGVGPETISLNGVLYTGFIGNYTSLETIATNAAKGEDAALIDSFGNVIGHYVITKIDEGQTAFYPNGVPRKKDFTIELKRTG